MKTKSCLLQHRTLKILDWYWQWTSLLCYINANNESHTWRSRIMTSTHCTSYFWHVPWKGLVNVSGVWLQSSIDMMVPPPICIVTLWWLFWSYDSKSLRPWQFTPFFQGKVLTFTLVMLKETQEQKKNYFFPMGISSKNHFFTKSQRA